MPAYNYEAFDQSGRTQKGVVAADSIRDARKRLQSKSLFPVNITIGHEKTRFSLGGISFSSRKKLKSKDLTLITRQLATMFSAGTPVEEALQAIGSQSEKKVVKDVITRLRSHVSEGKKLSEAMAQESDSFPALYRSMVKAGEASGDLGGIMERIADYTEKAEDIKNKISTAMIYPIVLSFVATSVLVILMTFVVPKVVSQFEDIGAELPALTKFVMVVSDFLVNYGFLLAILFLGLLGSYLWANKQKAFRQKSHIFFLNLPVIGKLILSISSAKFSRTLGTLIEGGSPVLESVMAAKETINNQVIRDAVDQVYFSVREGQSLSSAMRKTGVFSSLLVYMCSIGEKSGRLSHMLLKIADYLESEFDGFTQKALSLLEPMIVIIMGVMVGIIVMSIMLPIMRLNSLVLI